MTIAATGFTGAAVENLRQMVSESVTFQKLVKAANAAAALQKIYAFAEEGDPDRPFAIVTSEEMKRIGASGGSRTHFHPGGRLFLMLEVPGFWDGTVSAASTASMFTASGLAGHADDFFNGVNLKFRNGVNDGEELPIADFSGVSGLLNITGAFTNTPGVGDAFRILPANDGDAFRHYLNIADALIAEIEALSGAGGYMNLSNIVSSDWGRVRVDQGDDYFGGKIMVEYGI